MILVPFLSPERMVELEREGVSGIDLIVSKREGGITLLEPVRLLDRIGTVLDTAHPTRAWLSSLNRNKVVLSMKYGFIPVSTPEETAFDLLRFNRQIGGLDHVLTLLQELGDQLSPVRLAETAKVERVMAFAQRLGWMLEQAGFKSKVTLLLKWIHKNNPVATNLEPARSQKGSMFDARWNLWLNTTLEGDRV